MQDKRITIDNEEGTMLFAQQLAQRISGGMTIGLTGGLGVGKTFLVRALVRVVAPHAQVSSPSYVLCNEYSNEQGSIEHWDLYRTSSIPPELCEPPLPTTVRIIEWIERVPELETHADLLITIERVSESDDAENRRIITLRTA